MTYCVIGIGSNENPERQCHLMIEALRQEFGDIRVSDLRRTPAYGVDAADYMNGVIFFCTDLPYTHLKSWCRAIENELGRVRGQAKCCADLDILYFADTLPITDTLVIIDEYYKKGIKQVLAFYPKPA